MPYLLVCYDLSREPESVYVGLKALLLSLGASELQESVWGLETDMTAAKLHDSLRENPLFHNNDRLLVAEAKSMSSSNLLTYVPDFA